MCLIHFSIYAYKDENAVAHAVPYKRKKKDNNQSENLKNWKAVKISQFPITCYYLLL